MSSQRNVQILACLCDSALENQHWRIEDLALKFNVSVRTVRYDLDKIDYYLKTNNFPVLVREKGIGVRIKGSPETIESIRRSFSEISVDNYVLSKHERTLYIEMLLFVAEAPIKYEELAEELSVSRKTVIEDVRSIREKTNSDGTYICAAKNGLYYRGKELLLRRKILDQIIKIFTPMELWKLGFGLFLNRSIVIEKKWFEIIRNSDSRVMEELLLQVEEEHKIVISDDEFYLTLLLTVLSRNRQKHHHVVLAEESSLVTSPCLTANFFQQIEQKIHWSLSTAERQYIIFEAKRILNDSVNDIAEKISDFVVETLLVQVSEEMNKKYFLDNTLRMGLREHIVSYIRKGGSYRIEDDSTIQKVTHENEKLLATINICLDQLKDLHLNGQKKSESALIALHFIASDERWSTEDNITLKALVVCANGIGSSKIVSASVEKYFPQIQVVASTSVHNVQTIVEQNHPDFILSTVPLTFNNLPVIDVNTLLTNSDIENIRSYLSMNHSSNAFPKRRDVFQELWNLVTETSSIHDYKRLENGLVQILGIKKKRRSGLLDLISEKGILVGLNVTNWEEAIRESAKPLVQNGFLEPRYVEAMINNIKKMGPYIVIMPGIAVPHSLPKDGVLLSCMGIAILKQPIMFGNKVNDPVRIVICLGAKDNQEHMKDMSDLINIFGDSRMVEELCSANDVKEIIEILSEHCRI